MVPVLREFCCPLLNGVDTGKYAVPRPEGDIFSQRLARLSWPRVLFSISLILDFRDQQCKLQRLHDQQTDFNGDFLQPYSQDQPFPDSALMDENDFTAFSQNTAVTPAHNGSVAPTSSTDLVRRSRNQLVGPQHLVQQEQWNVQHGNMNGQPQQPGEEDENELVMKVQAAKRDAQGKRKQIPPFVQKLSR
nr:hypothetical protein CFP56_34665 [Quercus suber]